MEELERRRKRLSSTRTLVDCLFLLSVVFASSLPYVSRLGFYVDDWQYIPAFTTKGLIDGAQYILSVDENIRQLPVQLLYLANANFARPNFTGPSRQLQGSVRISF